MSPAYAAPVMSIAGTLNSLAVSTSESLAGLSVSDAYAAATGGTVTVQLADQTGTLSDSDHTSGSGTGTLVISGSVAAVNAELATVRYAAGAKPGTDTVVMTAGDSMGLADGAGGTVGVTVTPAYAAPVMSIAGTLNSLAVSTSESLAGLSVSDAYAAATGGTVTVQLADQTGTLSDSDHTSGSGTGTLVISGSVAAVNAELATVRYAAGAKPGTDTVVMTAGDSMGLADGAGGTVGVTVTPAYAAPVMSIAGTLNSLAVSTSESLAGLSVSDAYAAATGGTVTVQLADQTGTLSDSDHTSGSGTGTLVISGSVAAVNAELATVRYAAGAKPGTDTIVMTAGDSMGLADGAGGTVGVTVTPAYAAPVMSIAGTLNSLAVSTSESLAGLSVSDAYAAATGGTVTVQLADQTGTLSDSDHTSGSGTGTLVISGSVAAVNAELATVRYAAGAKPGTDTIVMTAGDSMGLADGAGGTVGVTSYQTEDSAATAQQVITPTTGGEEAVISFNSGNHSITVDNSNHLIEAGTGSNSIYLADGDTWITSRGLDTVVSGLGSETVASMGGTTSIKGGLERLTVLLGDAGSSAVVSDQIGSALLFGGGLGTKLSVYGDEGKDVIVAGLGATNLYGGGESDTVYASGAGNQFFSGTGGKSMLVGLSSGVTLVGQGDDDGLFAGVSGGNLLVAGGKNEYLIGSSSKGGNLYFGGPGLTTVYAGLGADTVYGGSGETQVLANAGSLAINVEAGKMDVFIVDQAVSANRSITINGYRPGTDVVGLFGYSQVELDKAYSTHIQVGHTSIMQLSDGTRISFVGVSDLHVNPLV